VSNALDPDAGLTTDEQAMWQVQFNDDPKAFASLMKRWETAVKRLCAQVTGDANLAEDLCQEAFAKVFLKRKQYRPSARFSTWLWRIALNLCYSRLRKKQFRLDLQLATSPYESAVASEVASERPSPRQDFLAHEEAEMVRQALLRLPDSSRLLLILRYWDGMKLREIASKLHVSETTVASRCAVALTKLARILERDFAR